MDYQTIFTYEILPHINTEKPLILLKKCSRCRSIYDYNNFKFDTKKNDYFKNCVTCHTKHSQYRYNKKEEKKKNIQTEENEYNQSIKFLQCSRCKKEYEKSKFKFDYEKQSYSKQCICCQEKQSTYRKNKAYNC